MVRCAVVHAVAALWQTHVDVDVGQVAKHDLREDRERDDGLRSDDKDRMQVQYAPCGPREDASAIPVYTVRSTPGARATMEKSECVSSAQLDFPATSSFAVLTMADKMYFDQAVQFVTSVRSVKHLGAPPARIVLADLGLTEEQRAELAGLPAAGIPLELRDYTGQLKALSTLPGAPYRVKAVFLRDMYAEPGADQLVYMDAGGILLASTHRLRNFVAENGFYAGTLREAQDSAMRASMGEASLKEMAQRAERMQANQASPSCFDYATDFLVNDTVSYTSGKRREVQELSTFEGGFLAVDTRKAWPGRVLRRWGAIASDDASWRNNLGDFFAHDQKILGNEVWKALLCDGDEGTVRVVDLDNIRFGAIVFYHEQPYKNRWSFHRSDRFPWAGYAYHYCMLGAGQTKARHGCSPSTDHVAPGFWREWADLAGAETVELAAVAPHQPAGSPEAPSGSGGLQ